MKKLLVFLIAAIMIVSSIMPVGAYSFNSNGIAIEKATAYRLPSKNSSTVWWVDKGDRLDVIAEKDDYYLVLYPFNNTGKHVLAYVPVSAVKVSNVPDAGDVYLNADATMIKDSILYHNPSTDQLIGASGSNQTKRALLYKGDTVNILFEKFGFYCVQTAMDTGFVPAESVMLNDEKSDVSKPCEHHRLDKQLISTERIGVKNKEFHNAVERYSVQCMDCGKVLQVEETLIQESHIDGDHDDVCDYCYEPIICEHSNTKMATETIITQLNADHHTVNTETYEYCTACGAKIDSLESYTSNEPHNFNGNVCVDCGFQKCSHSKTYTIEKHSEFKSQFDSEVHLLNTVVDVFCSECGALIESGKNTDKKEAHTFQGNTCAGCGYTKFENKTAWVATTGGSRLILRVGPSTNYKEIIRMPQGSEIIVTGNAMNGFYPVKYDNNYSGYASAQYLSFVKPTTSDISSKLGQRIANVSSYKDGITGECVWYVRGRAKEKLGINTGIYGNANQWYGLAKAKGLPTGTAVKSNSIACYNGGKYGHVIYVEEVVGNNVYYTEANVQAPISDGKISSLDGVLKVKSLSAFTSGSYQGCIYLK